MQKYGYLADKFIAKHDIKVLSKNDHINSKSLNNNPKNKTENL